MVPPLQDILGFLGDTIVGAQLVVEILVHFVALVDLSGELHENLVLLLEEADVHAALQLLLLEIF